METCSATYVYMYIPKVGAFVTGPQTQLPSDVYTLMKTLGGSGKGMFMKPVQSPFVGSLGIYYSNTHKMCAFVCVLAVAM